MYEFDHFSIDGITYQGWTKDTTDTTCVLKWVLVRIAWVGGMNDYSSDFIEIDSIEIDN